MAKIYIVRGVLADLKILEMELIKETPEQLKIDQKSIRIVWNGGRSNFIAYFSSRISRRGVLYFHTLPEAIEEAMKATQKKLETSAKNVEDAQLQLTELAAFYEAQKEESDAV